MRVSIRFMLVGFLLATLSVSRSVAEEPLHLVVMDPLCDRLACDCVEGYAQRKYEALGERLSKSLGRPVKVFWGESISSALEEAEPQRGDIVVGKHSVVESNAADLKWKLTPVAQLTGADGEVTQTGLIVVRKNDIAMSVDDLKGYRIFFGPADCDEKHKAPMKLLRDHGIDIPVKPEISGACSEAATELMGLDNSVSAAAVISSYAEPLLAGCDTVKKGDLRVIGISDEVPFVTLFLNRQLPESEQQKITKALLDASKDESIRKSLQSRDGFVPFGKHHQEQQSTSSDSRPDSDNATDISAEKKNRK